MRLLQALLISRTQHPTTRKMALAKEKVAAANQVGLKIYLGFEERACRLVFPFEERFASGAPPMLHTILPNGVLETEKVCIGERQIGVMCANYSGRWGWVICVRIVHAHSTMT